MIREPEAGLYVYDTFEEVRPYYEELFSKNGIEILYKLRNWRERFHPEVLTKGELYFSRPSELNDPFDIHTPMQFDLSVIDDPRFLAKMIETAPAARGINPGRDATIYAEKTLDEIKKDPASYFIKNYEDLINNPTYNDGIGVLSMTTNATDKQLWGYYGGGLKGFAVGYDPIMLCEELFAPGNFVQYTDKIPVSTIINVSQKVQHELLYQKTKEWGFESEFRFTRAIDPDDQERRIHAVSPKIIKEIILGPRIQEIDKDEILEVVHKRYPHARVIQLYCDYSNATLYGKEIGF